MCLSKVTRTVHVCFWWRKPTTAVWMGLSIYHRYLENFPQTELMRLWTFFHPHTFLFTSVFSFTWGSEKLWDWERLQVEKKVIVLLYVQHINCHSRVSNLRWNQTADIAIPNIPKTFHIGIVSVGVSLCFYAKWQDSIF